MKSWINTIYIVVLILLIFAEPLSQIFVRYFDKVPQMTKGETQGRYENGILTWRDYDGNIVDAPIPFNKKLTS